MSSNDKPTVSDRDIRLALAKTASAAISDQREHVAGAMVRKFSDGNVSLTGVGNNKGDLLEALDALELDICATILEESERNTPQFAEAMIRLVTIYKTGRVPEQVFFTRLRMVEKNSGGRVRVATATTFGCGNPECKGCGGDGSISDDDDHQPEGVPQSETLRTLH